MELSPEEIEALINKDRPTFIRLAKEFQQTAIEQLKAVDDRNIHGASENRWRPRYRLRELPQGLLVSKRPCIQSSLPLPSRRTKARRLGATIKERKRNSRNHN